MNFRKFINEKKKQDLDAGTILIAQPFWKDEKYSRSVIMILCHDETGTSGIILNKELPSSEIGVPLININIPVYYGGPFDKRIISYIHNNPDVPEAIYMGNDLYWGGDIEHLEEVLYKKRFDWNKIKFFAGFVEWSVGQIEEEIRKNKWHTGILKADELFSTSAHELWSNKLSDVRNKYHVLDEFPGPSLN